MTVTDTALHGVPLFSGMTDRALDAIGELASQRFAESAQAELGRTIDRKPRVTDVA